MQVYKITNKLNGKMYIGQTVDPIATRWHRHVQDAMSGRLNTHFARAIRKYGQDAFAVEQIDEANTQEELTKKEYYWIHYYDAVHKGYNETQAEYKCGGNTYLSKTQEEMKEIGQKIRQTKLGSQNPNSTAVKCRNEETGEEYHFGSMAEMQSFLNAPNHNCLSKRCAHLIRSLYRGIWNIAYEDSDYSDIAGKRILYRRGSKIHIKNLQTNEEWDFESFASAQRFFNLPYRYINRRAKATNEPFVINKIYEVTRLE